MFDERVVIPFPTDTIRLNGILLDTLTTVRCATSNLTYRENVGADSTFLLVSCATILDAIKLLTTNSELVIDTKAAATYAYKNLSNMSDEIALTAVLIMSIEKTILAQCTLAIDSSLIPAALKNIHRLDNSFAISSVVKPFLAKLTSMNSSFLFESSLANLEASKNFLFEESFYEILSAIDVVCLKYAGTIIDAAQFSSIVKFSVDRYRLLKDVDGLPFSAIDNWTLYLFDTIQI